MIRKLVPGLAVLLLWSGTSMVWAQSQPDEQRQQMEQMAQEMQQLQRRLGELQQQLQQLQQKQGQQQQQAPSQPSVAEEHQHKPDDATKKKVAVDGVLPKSWKIPGTDVSLSIGGYAKVDFIQDFDAIGDLDQFKTDTIPARGTAASQEGGQTTIHARETRFNVDLNTHTPKGKLRAFVEMDFFGDKNALRLRHAFGEFGNLLGGQTWTTFMDISARPLTLDYEGPDGEVFVRQPQVRWTQPVGEHWKFAVAVESPGGQFVVPSGLTGSIRSQMPDIPGYIRYDGHWGHIQVAGIARQIRFAGAQGFSSASETGLGMNTTFVLKSVGKDTLNAQFVFGEGVGKYVESLNGQNADAILLPTGSMELLFTKAGLIGYTRYWTPALRSGFGYAIADLERNPNLSASFIRRTQDVRGNLVWSPVPLVDLGGELMWGRRDNIDGSHGDAVRLQFAVKYNFH